MSIKVATSLVQGRQASVALAEKAIQTAMKKAKLQQASGVLLLLSTHFSSILQNTILAVAHHAQSTQVIGCTTVGFFTEEDWVLDCPAVAVMVFGGDLQIQLAEKAAPAQAIFTLAAPNAVHFEWLNNGAIRYGGISGDATGQGSYTVWQNAKGASAGHVEAYFSGVSVASRVSHGLTLFSAPCIVKETAGFDVLKIEESSACAHLNHAWQQYTKDDADLPQHRMMALYAENADALMQGNFAQTSLISLNSAKNSVTLAQAIKPGQTIAWAVRDVKNAQTDLVRTINQLTKESTNSPAFGLMFSSIGRGPFDDGIDHDLNIVTHMLNHVPLLGFYGNGTIAHVPPENQLLSYSVVLNLFTSNNT